MFLILIMLKVCGDNAKHRSPSVINEVVVYLKGEDSESEIPSEDESSSKEDALRNQVIKSIIEREVEDKSSSTDEVVVYLEGEISESEEPSEEESPFSKEDDLRKQVIKNTINIAAEEDSESEASSKEDSCSTDESEESDSDIQIDQAEVLEENPGLIRKINLSLNTEGIKGKECDSEPKDQSREESEEENISQQVNTDKVNESTSDSSFDVNKAPNNPERVLNIDSNNDVLSESETNTLFDTNNLKSPSPDTAFNLNSTPNRKARAFYIDSDNDIASDGSEGWFGTEDTVEAIADVNNVSGNSDSHFNEIDGDNVVEDQSDAQNIGLQENIQTIDMVNNPSSPITTTNISSENSGSSNLPNGAEEVNIAESQTDTQNSNSQSISEAAITQQAESELGSNLVSAVSSGGNSSFWSEQNQAIIDFPGFFFLPGPEAQPDFSSLFGDNNPPAMFEGDAGFASDLSLLNGPINPMNPLALNSGNDEGANTAEDDIEDRSNEITQEEYESLAESFKEDMTNIVHQNKHNIDLLNSGLIELLKGFRKRNPDGLLLDYPASAINNLIETFESKLVSFDSFFKSLVKNKEKEIIIKIFNAVANNYKALKDEYDKDESFEGKYNSIESLLSKCTDALAKALVYNMSHSKDIVLSNIRAGNSKSNLIELCEEEKEIKNYINDYMDDNISPEDINELHIKEKILLRLYDYINYLVDNIDNKDEAYNKIISLISRTKEENKDERGFYLSKLVINELLRVIADDLVEFLPFTSKFWGTNGEETENTYIFCDLFAQSIDYSKKFYENYTEDEISGTLKAANKFLTHYKNIILCHFLSKGPGVYCPLLFFDQFKDRHASYVDKLVSLYESIKEGYLISRGYPVDRFAPDRIIEETEEYTSDEFKAERYLRLYPFMDDRLTDDNRIKELIRAVDKFKDSNEVLNGFLRGNIETLDIEKVFKYLENPESARIILSLLDEGQIKKAYKAISTKNEVESEGIRLAKIDWSLYKEIVSEIYQKQDKDIIKFIRDINSDEVIKDEECINKKRIVDILLRKKVKLPLDSVRDVESGKLLLAVSNFTEDKQEIKDEISRSLLLEDKEKEDLLDHLYELENAISIFNAEEFSSNEDSIDYVLKLDCIRAFANIESEDVLKVMAKRLNYRDDIREDAFIGIMLNKKIASSTKADLILTIDSSITKNKLANLLDINIDKSIEELNFLNIWLANYYFEESIIDEISQKARKELALKVLNSGGIYKISTGIKRKFLENIEIYDSKDFRKIFSYIGDKNISLFHILIDKAIEKGLFGVVEDYIKYNGEVSPGIRLSLLEYLKTK